MGRPCMFSAVIQVRVVAERILPLGIVLVALICVPVLVWSPSGLPRLQSLQAEQAKVERAVTDLSAEIRRLREEVGLVKDDPRYIERAARDELGLVRQTEIVFQFKP